MKKIFATIIILFCNTASADYFFIANDQQTTTCDFTITQTPEQINNSLEKVSGMSCKSNKDSAGTIITNCQGNGKPYQAIYTLRTKSQCLKLRNNINALLGR